MFKNFDLAELSDADIHLVSEAFRILATQHNRFALDVLMVMLKETCRRHQLTAPDDYTDKELGNVMSVLTTAIDTARAHGADDELPIMQTLLLMSTAVVGELEERGCVVSQVH